MKRKHIKAIMILGFFSMLLMTTSVLLLFLCNTDSTVGFISTMLSVVSTYFSIVLSVVSIVYSYVSGNETTKTIRQIKKQNDDFVNKIHEELLETNYDEYNLENVKKQLNTSLQESE